MHMLALKSTDFELCAASIMAKVAEWYGLALFLRPVTLRLALLLYMTLAESSRWHVVSGDLHAEEQAICRWRCSCVEL
jgi:hypothetical protein